MADPSVPAPTPAPPTRRHIPVNQAFTTLLDNAERINDAAASDAYKTLLAQRGITAQLTGDQERDIKAARQKMQGAHAQRTARGASTVQKSQKRGHLETLLAGVQSAALQSDILDGTTKAPNYFVGADVGNADIPDLRQIAEGILSQLEHDDLPGISQDKEDEFEAAYEAWNTEAQIQTDARSGATQAQSDLETLIAVIRRRKQGTQLAADGLFPHQNPETETARTVFQLPKNRPYRPRLAKKEA